MAPVTRRRKRALDAAAPVIDPADRLSKLPDEILAEILSFLPAQEAVQTCVLARTWRGVWKLTRRLLITFDSVHEVPEFVDGLLRVRLDGLECAPLDACQIVFCEDDDDDVGFFDEEDTSRLNRWICRVLKCQVQSLRVDMGDVPDVEKYVQMSESRLVSRHLTRLELQGVMVKGGHLNLSTCPALEHLEMTCCCLSGGVTSPSLKRLVLAYCQATSYVVEICVPRLVSLWIEEVRECTPLLERMPDLVRAHVQVCPEDELYEDIDDDKCYLLHGLADAKHLEMIATSWRPSEKNIFQKDLRWCPTFSKLKTLVLDDLLPEPADCSLACILEHAPFLEQVTVILFNSQWSKYKLEVKGRLDETLNSTMISQHLKIVEVKCGMVDERVWNILKFFGTLNICFQIRATEK